METTSYKILIVDDSPGDIKLLMECLKDKYTLTAATSGEKAIQLASNINPDIVLMDVSMPTMNGYQACKKILENQQTHIIFVSANNTTEEIMQGYEAGGIDYIIKPFNPAELHTKIEFALESSNKQINTPTVAPQYTAIDTTRLILDFNKRCLTISDITHLSHLIINTTDTISLEATVQLHATDGIYEASSAGIVSKLESEILTRILQEEGRIFQNANRLFVTYDNVALMVKNLNSIDADQADMKTSLAQLIENANTMLLNVDRIHSLTQNTNQDTNHILKDVENHLQLMKKELDIQKEHKREGVKIIDEVLAKIESSFVDMGLTYNQEQALLSALHAGIDKSLKHFERGTSLDEHFEAILKDISTLLAIYK